MIKYIIFIISVSILNSSDNRCLIIPEESRTRPDLETFYLSSSGHFKIHYNTEGSQSPDQTDLNNNQVPDYVEEVAIIAEDSRYTLINIMGYLPEPDDGDGIYDIYIVNQSAWGWNVPESSITGASYVKIDNDYLGNTFNSNYCFDAIDKMRISVAHEFFHAIQRAYRPNYNTDHDFLLEMSSMWFEDLMVPNCNDYLSFTNYSSGIFKNPDQKFEGSESDNSASFGYSMALFGHYLSRVVDIEGSEDQTNSNIIRRIWEDYQTESNQIDVNAAGQSIINIISDYENSFSDVWTDFIARNMFSGTYNYFNEDIYYYSDQQYMSPLSFSYPSTSIGNNFQDILSLSISPYSANIVKLNSLENQLININYSYDKCLSEKISVIGSNDLITTLKYSNNNPIVLNESDLMYFISTAKSIECDSYNVEILSTPIPSDIISVYPNPIYYSGHISIAIESYSNIDDVLLRVYSINGKLILEQKNETFSSPFDFNISKALKASGVYLLSVTYNQKESFYKFAYIK